MTNRQQKKLYQKTHGYNPNEEDKIQQLIHETAEYTNQRLEEVKREGIYCTYTEKLLCLERPSCFAITCSET